jgi:hypothetical protein
VPEPIITVPFLRVSQHFISLCGFFEFVFGFFLVLRVALQVRVVLTGKPPKGLLDLVIRGGSIDSEHFIIIPFGHCSHLFRSRETSAFSLVESARFRKTV